MYHIFLLDILKDHYIHDRREMLTFPTPFQTCNQIFRRRPRRGKVTVDGGLHVPDRRLEVLLAVAASTSQMPHRWLTFCYCGSGSGSTPRKSSKNSPSLSALSFLSRSRTISTGVDEDEENTSMTSSNMSFASCLVNHKARGPL